MYVYLHEKPIPPSEDNLRLYSTCISCFILKILCNPYQHPFIIIHSANIVGLLEKQYYFFSFSAFLNTNQ